jgi:glycosyltransferase involved in cell wall biosynthesis
MKILIVDELFYPLGGVQVRFKDLAEEWVNLGHSVTMTAIDHLGTLAHEEVINGVVYNRILKDTAYYKFGRFGRKLSTILKYSLTLDRYFKQEWDLIIFGQFPMMPQIFYKLFYKKCAVTALDFVEYRDSVLWRIINRVIINSVDKIICISNHIQEKASLYRHDNLYVIPSFVDVNKSVSKSKTNYIFLGRMEQHKHPESAVEAVIEYNKVYKKNVNLNLVGGGNMLEGLKNKYGNIPYIRFLGAVDEIEKREVLEDGRMLIFPSEREGLPIVVIEAMSYGIPTVTTEYPGNGAQYFVKQEEIGKVALPNISSIADKINEIEENYAYFTNKCDEVKGNYDTKILSKKYLDIFNK